MTEQEEAKIAADIAREYAKVYRLIFVDATQRAEDFLRQTQGHTDHEHLRHEQ